MLGAGGVELEEREVDEGVGEGGVALPDLGHDLSCAFVEPEFGEGVPEPGECARVVGLEGEGFFVEFAGLFVFVGARVDGGAGGEDVGVFRV